MLISSNVCDALLPLFFHVLSSCSQPQLFINPDMPTLSGTCLTEDTWNLNKWEIIWRRCVRSRNPKSMYIFINKHVCQPYILYRVNCSDFNQRYIKTNYFVVMLKEVKDSTILKFSLEPHLVFLPLANGIKTTSL